MKITNIDNSKLDTLDKVYHIIQFEWGTYNVPFWVGKDFLFIDNFTEFKEALILMINKKEWYIDICGDLTQDDICNLCKIDYEYTKWNCIK